MKNKKNKCLLGSIALVFLFSSSAALAKNSFLESLNKRQEVKKQTRWTLADWLETKEKIRLMDMWLAANTSDQLFEFILGYNAKSVERTLSDGTLYDPAEIKITGAELIAYISLLGVGYSTEESPEEDFKSSALSIYLRILGAAEQSTNLTLHYGQKTTEAVQNSESYKSNFYGASLRLYVFNFFGLYGRYSKFGEAELPFNVGSVSSEQSEFGIFIDIGPLQISANVFKDEMDLLYNSQVQSKEGTHLSARLYF